MLQLQAHVTRTLGLLFPIILATYVPFCAPAIRMTAPAEEAEHQSSQLWHEPDDLSAYDAFAGPWGEEYAPDPRALYKLSAEKTHGYSPGMTVRDPNGERWSVKQGPEGPVEVTVSRILSALGYHQPPIYYLPSFRLDHGDWIEVAPGGRFRPHDKILKNVGEWSWQQNPFVGTAPYQSLLVTLLVFNSSDLKNSNNTLYELKKPREGATTWYVVRDLGAALGETGRFAPTRNDLNLFTRLRFITGVKDGYVQFDYHGFHQELIRNRITPSDVVRACDGLAQLSRQQWADAFRAGGYRDEEANRFIDRILERIDEGRRLRGSETIHAAVQLPALAIPGVIH